MATISSVSFEPSGTWKTLIDLKNKKGSIKA